MKKGSSTNVENCSRKTPSTSITWTQLKLGLVLYPARGETRTDLFSLDYIQHILGCYKTFYGIFCCFICKLVACETEYWERSDFRSGNCNIELMI